MDGNIIYRVPPEKLTNKQKEIKSKEKPWKHIRVNM